ncbi:MAG: hypothetical protein Q8S21_00925 [Candidatus Paracaedibacteraceae bacterium]|nr:hypothetical protein [Candidatus Paracaedibacteraceae bacterium]
MAEKFSPVLKNVEGRIAQISYTTERLKMIADTTNYGTKDQIPLAINLKDDLNILLEYSDKIAKRLDEVLEKARDIDIKVQKYLGVAEIDAVTHQSANAARTVAKTVAEIPESAAEKKVEKQIEAFKVNGNTRNIAAISGLDLSENEQDFFLSNLLPSTDLEQRKSNQNAAWQQSKAVAQKVGVMAKLRGLR